MKYLMSEDEKKEKLEKALYSWLDTIEIIEQDILDLVDHNNIAKSKIAKHVSDMKLKLRTMENILKYY